MAQLNGSHGTVECKWESGDTLAEEHAFVVALEALRVVAPTANGGLRGALNDAAERLEQGAELDHAFDETIWFDAEFRRLLEVGQSSGELPEVLTRLSRRGERRTRRLLDRLTTLLEPAVILALAALVGLVVMAAVLPLVRLQEIL